MKAEEGSRICAKGTGELTEVLAKYFPGYGITQNLSFDTTVRSRQSMEEHAQGKADISDDRLKDDDFFFLSYILQSLASSK